MRVPLLDLARELLICIYVYHPENDSEVPLADLLNRLEPPGYKLFHYRQDLKIEIDRSKITAFPLRCLDALAQGCEGLHSGLLAAFSYSFEDHLLGRLRERQLHILILLGRSLKHKGYSLLVHELLRHFFRYLTSE